MGRAQLPKGFNRMSIASRELLKKTIADREAKTAKPKKAKKETIAKKAAKAVKAVKAKLEGAEV